MVKPARERRNTPLDHDPDGVVYARKNSGLNQAEAADKIGISASLLNEIEHGKRNATPATQIKMAAVYNCPRVVLQRKLEVAS